MSHFNPPPGTLYKPTAVESDGDYSCDSSKCMENGSFDDDCSASPESASCNDGYHYTQGARSPTTCSCDCYTSEYPHVFLFPGSDNSCQEDYRNSGFEENDSCCMDGPSDGLCCTTSFATCCSKDNNPTGTSALHAGRSTGGCSTTGRSTTGRSTRAAPRRVAPRGGCRSF